MTNDTSIIIHTLYDCASGETKKFTIDLTRHGIMIRPEGYGDMFSPDNHGWPILVELYERKPQVVVWGDINQDDCTDIVTMEGARETERQGEDQ